MLSRGIRQFHKANNKVLKHVGLRYLWQGGATFPLLHSIPLEIKEKYLIFQINKHADCIAWQLASAWSEPNKSGYV